MRSYIVYTEGYKNSKQLANNLSHQARSNGLDPELVSSVKAADIETEAENLGLKFASIGNIDYKRERQANGITHYKLYKQITEPTFIMEYDVTFIGGLPESIPSEGVIQVSNHNNINFHACSLKLSNKSFTSRYRPEEPLEQKIIEHYETKGLYRWPLYKLMGTSGYIMTPASAQRMCEYIEKHGVKFGDRISTLEVGEGNLYGYAPFTVRTT